MRVLVCPHQLGMGGSQLNAIEMAVAVRRHGHDASVYAPPGILSETLEDMDVPWLEAPQPGSLSNAWSRRLGQIVREQAIDVIHAYEWRPCLQAAFARGLRAPLLMSVMAMEVPRFLPTHLPVVVGTPALAERMANQGREAYLLEPPVDMNRYRTRDVSAARKQWGIGAGELVVSVVSMLTTDLEKLQGVLTAMAVIDRLASFYPVRLVIAGDGEGLPTVTARAGEINARHGRTVVQPVGFQLDAVSVYEAADVVLGMGSSAIKGLAHGKPLIVQGEGGFWKLLDDDAAAAFIHEGWFGHDGAGVRDLVGSLTRLLDDRGLRNELGAMGRRLVERRYSLAHAAAELSGIYVDTVMRPHRLGRTTASLARSAVSTARYYATMQLGGVVEREKWAREGASA